MMLTEVFGETDRQTRYLRSGKTKRSTDQSQLPQYYMIIETILGNASLLTFRRQS